MAKIKVTGSAAVLESTLTLEDIRLLAKHRPKALALYEDDKPVFGVSVSSTGSVTKNGVCFASATRDAAGLAEITQLIPADAKNAKEFAAEAFGPAKARLGQVETQAGAALVEVKAALTQLLEEIVVV